MGARRLRIFDESSCECNEEAPAKEITEAGEREIGTDGREGVMCDGVRKVERDPELDEHE